MCELGGVDGDGNGSTGRLERQDAIVEERSGFVMS